MEVRVTESKKNDVLKVFLQSAELCQALECALVNAVETVGAQVPAGEKERALEQQKGEKHKKQPMLRTNKKISTVLSLLHTRGFVIAHK